MDFTSIWLILNVIKIRPKSLKSSNSEGSGSDQNPDRKAREPSPDRVNNSYKPAQPVGTIIPFSVLNLLQPLKFAT